MTTTELIHRLNARRNGTGWTAKCPAHDDGTASLSITEGKDGRTLLHCHAGCTAPAILSAMGLKMSDLFPPREATAQARIVKTYDYQDATGKMIFQVCRFDPKGFRQRRPDPAKPGNWLWNMDGIKRVLYRLPQVIEAMKAGQVIYVVEGEKDADALVKLGLCAITNPGGAGKWQPNYTETLTGAQVVIPADKDGPGRKHAALVAQALHGKASSVKILELPDRDGRRVKDAADWISAGGTLAELQTLVEAAPVWAPAETLPNNAERTGANDSTELKAALFEIKMRRGQTAAECNHAMAQAIIATLHRRGQFFFHADYCDHATAMFFDARRKLLLQIGHDSFQSWLADFIGINRTERTFAFIFAAIEDETLNGQTTGLTPEAYWARRASAISFPMVTGRPLKSRRAKSNLWTMARMMFYSPPGAR